MRADAELHLGAGADEHDLGPPDARLFVDEHVRAAGDAALGPLGRALQHRHASAGTRMSALGPSLSRCTRHASRGLVRVGGADHPDAGHRAHRRELLDGLVRRAVLADPDRVVRPDERHLVAGQRGDAHGAAHVVAEHEERAAERQQVARRHPVHDRAHAVLTDPEVDLAALEVVGADHARVGEQLRARCCR